MGEDCTYVEVNSVLINCNVLTWKRFPHYWALCEGKSIGHRWIPIIKGQCCGALRFPLVLTWTSYWTHSGVFDDLKSNDVQHDDVIRWKHFPRYWPFVRGIHRSPVNSPHKGQRRGALMFSLICAWINGWVNNDKAGDLGRHRVHCDVIVMSDVHRDIPWPTCSAAWLHELCRGVRLWLIWCVYAFTCGNQQAHVS